MLSLIKKIVGTKNDREIKRISPYVDDVNRLEAEYQRLSDAELKTKTDQFRGRLAEGTASLRQELEEARGEAASTDPEERDERKTRVEELDKDLRATEGRKNCCRKLLPRCGRRRGAPSGCVISTCN